MDRKEGIVETTFQRRVILPDGSLVIAYGCRIDSMLAFNTYFLRLDYVGGYELLASHHSTADTSVRKTLKTALDHVVKRLLETTTADLIDLRSDETFQDLRRQLHAEMERKKTA